LSNSFAQNLLQLEADAKHLNSSYQSGEPLQLYNTLDRKYGDVIRHLQEGVEHWSECAACHTDYDEQVAVCQKQIVEAEQFEEGVCSAAYKLQSQLLLEAKVKVRQLITY